ncbi:SDR family oxidoreductase [Ferruginibacter sp.]|uniref:SDR family oxidoreductase n=1 Tax=Ferruginibacter sp. TaxID=1940288 RepID=UPI0019BEBAF5|nr:NmrA family NAD(P)-binding protein [Ferruginibacter sp.]MBC7629631.1 NmrA family NAD(P)-binding protein [Ferruginibacter sp.]
MNITLTGSLGNISKPLTETLVQKGHSVTVISSKAERQKDIEALGATAAIGPVQDVDFLTKTFKGSDVVYCMAPPDFSQTDIIAYHGQIGRNYADAIKVAGVTHAIYLSSFGAHRSSGVGIIAGAHNAEKALGALQNVSITFMRPTSFYYNFYNFVPMIRNAGFIAANYGADDMLQLVSPTDIAIAIAEEIAQPYEGRKIRYVCSDERSCNEIASVLGTAIGMPNLKWNLISNEQMQAGMQDAGLPEMPAAQLTEMYAGLHNGNMAEDYLQNRPGIMGNVKLEDFAKEFAAVYNK